MILLKACPRCRGDLKTEKDIYGEYRECLQCGYMEDIEAGGRTSDSKHDKTGKRAA